jgi:hypothetical protein
MTDTNDTTTSKSPLSNLPRWVIPAVIAGVIVLLLIITFATKNGVTNKGNQKEQDLNAQYNDNSNYLSDCIVRIRESAGVVKGQTAALDQVLTDAVKGRYDKGSSAQVGGGQLFSAIKEAYPDLSAIGSGFDKVLTVVNGCRTDYRDIQTKLQRMIADFEKWRTGSFTVRTFGGGFPNNNLKAAKGDTILHGQAALDQMSTVVLVREAKEAQTTHEVAPEDPFGSTSTTGR